MVRSAGGGGLRAGGWGWERVVRHHTHNQLYAAPRSLMAWRHLLGQSKAKRLPLMPDSDMLCTRTRLFESSRLYQAVSSP